MAVVELPTTFGSKSSFLPRDLLEAIFRLVDSHDRRVTIPIVCKAWRETVVPNETTRSLWEDVEIRDVRAGGALAQGSRGDEEHLPLQQVKLIHRWLSDRRGCLSKLTVLLCTSKLDGRGSSSSVPSWARPFGLALSALVIQPDAKLKQLTIRGPSAHPDRAALRPGSESRDADSAGAVLRGAFSLGSLEELYVDNIPWTASLRRAVLPDAVATSCPAASPASATCAAFLMRSPQLLQLTNLRSLTINRCFYDDKGSDTLDLVLLDCSTVEAWAALGEALAALPLLERLDLACTHAMTYCDPARGVAPSPWPSLGQLKELSLAHDLSVQPPPSPAPTAAVAVAAPSSQTGAGCPVAGGAPDVADGPARLVLDADPRTDDPPVGASGDDDAGWAGCGLEEQLEALSDPPILTVDAPYALVELHSWLPGCAALTSLDLTFCGLAAVPLAVAHLPALARLDMYGNPLSSMRLPGPLRSLTWLRLSLDPCYDLLYDMLAADLGEGAAMEDMYTVELVAPVLQELQVDTTSSRALDLLREAAATIPTIRCLVLHDRSDEALR